MEIILVDSKTTIDEFHNLPLRLYSDDQNWVCPLRMMVEEVFDPQKNHGFVNGDARRWLVKIAKKTLGRIAAFYDRSKVEEGKEPAGCIGFFECENNQEAANLLFDTAKAWLYSEGFMAMDGPVNFGENFFNWGLLVDGFVPQGFGMPYNLPYYKQLFSQYGFQTYYQQYSYHLDITSPDLPERFWKIAEWVAKKPDFSYKTFSFKDREGCIQDFLAVY